MVTGANSAAPTIQQVQVTKHPMHYGTICLEGLGCITQLAGDLPVPVAHTVELLDWATGGPMPAALAGRGASAAAPAERQERAPAR